MALGTRELPELTASLDAAIGSHFADVVAWMERDAEALPVPTSVPNDKRWLMHDDVDSKRIPYLTRYLMMTLEEAVVGTAIMWLWEKSLAAKKMPTGKLENEETDMQFIISSLVYNSGLIHQRIRWKMIHDFASVDWIYARSEANAKTRWRLNVFPEKQIKEQALALDGYPEQPTAWLAAYHVLQRYGGYVGLKKFGNIFDRTTCSSSGRSSKKDGNA